MSAPDQEANDPQEPLLPERLARAITLAGPIPLSQFMGAANAHYYATRDPLGVRGDFTTAPEISQMFGELIGLWLADLWDRAGRPAARYVEFGPGRGTLAVDALRAMARAGLEGLLLFAVLWFFFWRTDSRYQPGKLVGIFVLGYGLCRFFVEFFREPDAQLVWLVDATGLHMGQWLCIPMIVGGVWLYLWARR